MEAEVPVEQVLPPVKSWETWSEDHEEKLPKLWVSSVSGLYLTMLSPMKMLYE